MTGEIEVPRQNAPRARVGGAARPGGSETGLSRFLESVPEATLVVGTDGHIQQANLRAAELFGYGAGELLGLEIEALIPESERAGHRRAREAFARAPRDRSMGRDLEIVARHHDGSRFPVDVELRPRVVPEGVVVLTVVRDLSQQQLEADALRARDLQRRLYLSRLAGEDLEALLAQVLACLHRVAATEAAPGGLGSPIEEAWTATSMAQDLVVQLVGYTYEDAGPPDLARRAEGDR